MFTAVNPLAGEAVLGGLAVLLRSLLESGVRSGRPASGVDAGTAVGARLLCRLRSMTGTGGMFSETGLSAPKEWSDLRGLFRWSGSVWL